MKKKTRQRMMNVEPARQRRLGLARDTVRTLGHDELVNAVGGETGCDSTTTPTQTLLTTRR
jgi:hypothetical protein